MTILASLSRGIGNVRSLFPFSHEGRQSLIYICIAWAAPVLCAMLIWAMGKIETFPGAVASERLARFADIADRISWGLMVILVAFACFVSIRAIKLNAKNGTVDVESHEEAADAAQVTADAAQAKADEIKEGA